MTKNSLKQMMRTPVRTALFFLLVLLASAIVTLGASLFAVGSVNLRQMEESFTTIGTVQQRRADVGEVRRWNAGLGEEEIFQTVRYGEPVSLEVLNFEGADYIEEPEKRPYYYAYLPDMWVGNLKDDYLIARVTPSEDCVPDHPVKLELLEVLYWENLVGDGEVYFCDHYNENPQPLYAGESYMVFLKSMDLDHESSEAGISREYVPVSLEGYQYTKTGERVEMAGGVPEGYEKITEDFYEPGGHGTLWQSMAQAAKRWNHVIPVGVTGSTNLLMAFYTGEAYICDGRDITAREYETGERVCLISKELADEGGESGWRLGGEVKLSLFGANYESSPGADFQESGFSYPGWLNAQGERFPVFLEQTYRVVGVYDTLPGASLAPGYSLGYGEIVVPAGSIKESDENNITAYGPMTAYNTSFQIPNGSISSFLEAWEAQGIDSLDIAFYDGGYTRMREGLEQMKGMGVTLFGAGVTAAFLILLFFSKLLIGKQKLRTAMERSLGLNPRQCRRSLLAGMMLVAALGIWGGCGLGCAMTGRAWESVGWDQVFDTAYSSSNLRAGGGNIRETEGDGGQWIGSIGILTGGFMFLAVYGAASLEIRKNIRCEPLRLFGS